MTLFINLKTKKIRFTKLAVIPKSAILSPKLSTAEKLKITKKEQLRLF